MGRKKINKIVIRRGYMFKGEKPIHRIVVEDMLGRKMKAGEHIHHKNGDKLDNRPENLEIFPNWKAHINAHTARRIFGLKAPRFNVIRPCACGCGQLILHYDPDGSVRLFAWGHDKPKQRQKIVITPYLVRRAIME